MKAHVDLHLKELVEKDVECLVKMEKLAASFYNTGVQLRNAVSKVAIAIVKHAIDKKFPIRKEFFESKLYQFCQPIVLLESSRYFINSLIDLTC